jgi:hypothetical protein
MWTQTDRWHGAGGEPNQPGETMSTALRITLAVLLTATVLAGGCSKTAATPKEAVTNMVKAIDNNDKSAFKDVVCFGEGNQEAGEAMFDMMAAMVGFQKELQKAYGKDVVGPMGKNIIPTDDELAKMEIKEEGDKATAKVQDKPMPLIKKDGKWYVDLTKDAPSASEKDKMIKQSKKLVDAINKAKANIGKDGYTAEKINEELTKAMAGIE